MTEPMRKRFSPQAIDGATSRTLLIVDDSEALAEQAVAAGATRLSQLESMYAAGPGARALVLVRGQRVVATWA